MSTKLKDLKNNKNALNLVMVAPITPIYYSVKIEKRVFSKGVFCCHVLKCQTYHKTVDDIAIEDSANFISNVPGF